MPITDGTPYLVYMTLKMHKMLLITGKVMLKGGGFAGEGPVKPKDVKK